MRFGMPKGHGGGDGILAAPLTERDHIQGAFDAPFTLVEYGDYECPACGATHSIVKAVQEALQGKLCFVFRQFPLINIHPHAERAAEAAEASDEQGHFWDMHNTLFENQDALDDQDLARYAAELGLDVRRLIWEISAAAYSPRIKEDFMSGVRSGVNGTPTFFMNGVRYDGPHDSKSMVAALAEAESEEY
jgi:protein-disulfide isomerase